MERIVISIPEMAEAIGVSRTLAYEMVKMPNFPAVKLGERRIGVIVEDLKQWLRNGGFKEKE